MLAVTGEVKWVPREWMRGTLFIADTLELWINWTKRKYYIFIKLFKTAVPNSFRSLTMSSVGDGVEQWVLLYTAVGIEIVPSTSEAPKVASSPIFSPSNPSFFLTLPISGKVWAWFRICRLQHLHSKPDLQDWHERHHPQAISSTGEMGKLESGESLPDIIASLCSNLFYLFICWVRRPVSLLISSKLAILPQQYSAGIHAFLRLFLKWLFKMFANLISSVQAFEDHQEKKAWT